MHQNCFKNGSRRSHPQTSVDRFAADAALDGAVFTVDLERQEVARPNGERLRFEIKPFRRRILLDGLDDIALTLKRASAIDALERRQ